MSSWNLQGRGLTNYNLDKPSYAFTAETTEFDDQLIRREIVTMEAAIMAKGASQQEAERLTALKRDHKTRHTQQKEEEITARNHEDEEFMRSQRQLRLEELRKEREQPTYGDVIPISRPEWAHHVNEASIKSWVVVCLIADSDRTGCMERAIAELAVTFLCVKFVSIHHRAAIPNWPERNLPSLFVYRHGKLQHQLISMSCTMSTEELEWKLGELGVLETTRKVKPKPSITTRIRGYDGTSTFGGIMSSLATQPTQGDDQGNYDDVD